MNAIRSAISPGSRALRRAVESRAPIVRLFMPRDAGAALLSAISFGGAHFLQGWRSCAVIVFFALGFQTGVWASGSLFVAMAVHIAYDMTAGITYGRLGRELGYTGPERSAGAS